MKTSNFKLSIIAGCMVLISAFTVNEALAQRPSRGQSGGGRPSAGGSTGSRPPRPSVGTPSRPSTPSHGHIGRPPVVVRPGYRPGFRPYRRPYYGYYNFYRPYLGLSINVLPYGYYPFYFGADQFYYSGGLFYRQYDNNYKVVVPPVGAQVPSIPSDAKEVVINGQTFYEYKGVYYNAVQDANGKTVYVVAGKDGVLNTDNIAADSNSGPQVGDIVDQLPDGYREVFIKGEQYYVSEDGVYYEKIVTDGKVSYKVIGLGN
ncbi:DUF6515 family protein [Pedobacter heparinus]|nr:DUF6515 family protein [Pedobacter heparinus]